MSSWIISNIGINRFLGEILKCPDEKFKTNFGRKLLKMNIEATEQRYIEPYLNQQQKKERLKNFRFSQQPINKIQSLKSLSCFLYQCSEGSIPKRKLYKEMRDKETALAFDIINELPEYDKAEWG